MASSTMATANGVASEKGADGKARNMAAEPTDHDARSVRDGARGNSSEEEGRLLCKCVCINVNYNQIPYGTG